MSLTKYASFEVSDILEIKGSPTRQYTASLDKLGDYENYRTSDGFMYVRLRAISSRCNKNHDGWPSIELAGSPEIFERHHGSGGFTIEAGEGGRRGFATFMGKPFFIDHHNSNPKKARGVIVDSKFSVLDHKTAASDDYWGGHDVDPEHLPPAEVELLIEIDAKEFPKVAADIRNGHLDGFSMGCDVEYSKCSHCGHIAHNPEEFCSHIMMKGAHHDYKTADGHRTSKKSYENCYGITFFEISGVFDPADETALAREVKAGVNGPPMSGYIKCPQCGGQGCPGCGYSGEMTAPAPGSDGAFTPDIEQMVQRGGQGTVEPINQPDLLRQYGSTHTAENPLPQEFLTRAPEEIDTLRDESICPICSSEMEGETCDVCGYVQPPKEFDNPDLTKAVEMRQQMKQQEEQPLGQPQQPGQEGAQPGQAPGGPLTSQLGQQPPPTKMPATATAISDMSWTPNVHPKTAARINQVERPITTSPRPASDEPAGAIVKSDQTIPVTSAMLTARHLMANAQRNHQGDSMSTRTADGATAPDAAADQRVDATGVGGVMDASNEEASKAQAQIDVTGIGGTGVEGVEADSTESLPTASESGNDSGFNTDRTTDDSGPTATYGDSDGTEKAFTDPVTSEPFPASEDGVKKGYHQAYDDGVGDNLQDIPQGGGANQGTQPVDPIGKAGDRVDVLKAVTSPSNNSGPTDTWSGTDGNSIYRQQDPVTQESQEWGGVKVPDVTLHTRAHMISAFRLAEAEVELGLIPAEEKFNRVAELQETHPTVISTRLDALAQVKTAGLAKLASTRTAGVRRLPSAFGKETAAPNGFRRIAADEALAETPITEAELDQLLFTR